MRVECAACGWWEEVESEVDALARYSLHQLEVHPHTALYDDNVRLWVAMMASVIAPTNGALTGPKEE